MPEYSQIELCYQPRGAARVWSQGPKTYSWSQRGKLGSPNSQRQAQFESELRDLAVLMRRDVLPVYVSWPNALRMRMDWGCIGHAVASGFLEAPLDNHEGYVSHVHLRRR